MRFPVYKCIVSTRHFFFFLLIIFIAIIFTGFDEVCDADKIPESAAVPGDAKQV